MVQGRTEMGSEDNWADNEPAPSTLQVRDLFGTEVAGDLIVSRNLTLNGRGGVHRCPAQWPCCGPCSRHELPHTKPPD